MKRDMDFVREILKTCADADGVVSGSVFVDSSRDLDYVGYHFEIMQQAGLVNASIQRELNGRVVHAQINSLTWDGNEFIAAISNDKIWSQIKKKLSQKSVDATFDVIKALGVKMISALVL